MKKGLITTGIAVVAMVMFSTYVFADGGWGRHHRGEGYRMGGAEDCPRFGGSGEGRYGKGNSGEGRYGKGNSNWGNLSEEDAAKLDKAREVFFEDTKDVRQSIYQKRLAMRAEMAKKDPDAKKLGELQQEVSDLKADFDQKRLNHRLEMKKLLPDDYQASGRMGRGRGYGRGAGGDGGCWRQ